MCFQVTLEEEKEKKKRTYDTMIVEQESETLKINSRFSIYLQRVNERKTLKIFLVPISSRWTPSSPSKIFMPLLR